MELQAKIIHEYLLERTWRRSYDDSVANAGCNKANKLRQEKKNVHINLNIMYLDLYMLTKICIFRYEDLQYMFAC
jgi:hypothetical protein